MPYTIGNAQLSGMELVTSNFEAIEEMFYKVLYTETQWKKALPEGSLMINIPEGAQYSSYAIQDVTGRAELRTSHSGDIPVIGQSMSKSEPIPIYTATVAASIDDNQAREMQYAYGASFQDNLPEILGLACDRCVDYYFYYGSTELGYKPWIKYPGVTVVGSASGPWSGVDGDQIVEDIESALHKVWSDSKQVFVPGAVWLPTDQFGLITSKRIPDINMTVIEYVEKNNIYTRETGEPLLIKPCPHLKGAGDGGVDRMLVETHTDRYHKMPFPIPFRILPPHRVEYGVKLIAEVRFGSYHNRQPSSMLYMDNI